MALNIKNANVDRLARRSAELRETSLTDAVEAALERDVFLLENEREAEIERRLAAIRQIQRRVAATAMLDARSTRDIQNELDDDVLDRHR